ncbi:DUF72 domain-containing protein [Actinokineospora iranica]|uniref:Uncharacterized conserved protein YecE, DUF72 family n=1 Tax=Actinokineospora iranica TaxID=1271860 RepID=A0A1G6LN64_9PSEU|nr:DUF72 domain-containing protein [Actinokineospora iranica]SDC44517.1 Uncharacterized conserved protein YecE, DUF72 family [Actinokineospora iranica]
MIKTGRVRIGTSGWVYPEWRKVYYPPGLPHRQELPYLSRRVDTIEINGTFYGPRKPADFRRWRDLAPDGFVFAVKGPRLVTHVRRLRSAEEPVAEFFGSGVLELGEKLGPILWQVPASLRFDPEVLGGFLRVLPRDQRHALEVRHPSFARDEVADLLAAHGVALVVSDSPGVWPSLLTDTADFAYLRLHGDTELYKSAYSDTALDLWADRVCRWRHERDVYVYFDNTMAAAAPGDAEKLAGRVRAAAA